MSLLTLLLVVPAIGALVVASMARFRIGAKLTAFTFSVATLLAAVAVWTRFDPSVSAYQFVESHAWLPLLGISFLLGIDAVSLVLVLMTAALSPLALLAGAGTTRMGETAASSLVLLLEAAVIGAFLAIDVCLFYLFWLLALVVLALIVGLWGGGDHRHAGLVFGVLTGGGSLLMLLVILACHHIHFIQSGSPSFDARHWEGLVLTPMVETWLFWGVFVAFAIQTPLFPFQGWLTGIARGSTTAGHVLAGTVLVKIGAYGLARFAVPWFPRASWTFAPVVTTVAALSLLIGAVAAVVSTDTRTFAARVTAAQMGLVVLGVFGFAAAGVKSAFMLPVSHGFFMAGLLFSAGKEQGTGDPRIGGPRPVGRSRTFGFVIPALLVAAAVVIPAYRGIAIIRSALERLPFQAAAAAAALTLLTIAFGRLARRWLQRGGDKYGKGRLGSELLPLMALVLLVLWMGIAPGGVVQSLDSAARAFASRVDDHVLLTE